MGLKNIAQFSLVPQLGSRLDLKLHTISAIGANTKFIFFLSYIIPFYNL